MTQRLVNDHRLVVGKETVGELLKILDPEGVELRARHRLKRRQYITKGPNHLWHIDGYDKLKPFGCCIYGAIDGFSSEFYGLTLDTPTMILPLFLSTVCGNLEELQGLLELIAELRMDMSQRYKGLLGEMVKMIGRGMTVSSMENQFLTNESKPGGVY